MDPISDPYVNIRSHTQQGCAAVVNAATVCKFSFIVIGNEGWSASLSAPTRISMRQELKVVLGLWEVKIGHFSYASFTYKATWFVWYFGKPRVLGGDKNGKSCSNLECSYILVCKTNTIIYPPHVYITLCYLMVRADELLEWETIVAHKVMQGPQSTLNSKS